MLFYNKIFICVRECYIFAALIFFLCFVPFSISEHCEFINPCSCRFKNGSVIDLTPIASPEGARFSNVKSQNDSYSYFYNPCYDFKVGSSYKSCAIGLGVAICQVDSKEEEFQNCGDQEHVTFFWNNTNSVLTIEYRYYPRTTNVTVVCSKDLKEPKLDVIGERVPDSKYYEMTLYSECACADVCGRKVSFGTGLVIIFFITLLMYLCLGIVYMRLVKGAHGCEMIPNYEFWIDFPLLVRDGCVYISSGCRSESSYERI